MVSCRFPLNQSNECSLWIVLCMGGAWCYIPIGWLLLAKPFLVPIFERAPVIPQYLPSGNLTVCELENSHRNS